MPGIVLNGKRAYLHFHSKLSVFLTLVSCLKLKLIKVWDVLSNNEVASIVWKANSEEAAARAVVEAATATWRKKFPASKIDDCTVVCLFLQSNRHLH